MVPLIHCCGQFHAGLMSKNLANWLVFFTILTVFADHYDGFPLYQSSCDALGPWIEPWRSTAEQEPICKATRLHWPQIIVTSLGNQGTSGNIRDQWSFFQSIFNKNIENSSAARCQECADVGPGLTLWCRGRRNWHTNEMRCKRKKMPKGCCVRAEKAKYLLWSLWFRLWFSLDSNIQCKETVPVCTCIILWSTLYSMRGLFNIDLYSQGFRSRHRDVSETLRQICFAHPCHNLKHTQGQRFKCANKRSSMYNDNQTSVLHS